jgi:hypothetical protein
MNGAVPAIATDADVNVAAGLMTSAVLKLATPPDLSDPAISLLGFREGWIFTRALDSRLVEVRGDDYSCDWCWTSPAAPDSEAQAKVESLLPESSDDLD